MKQAMGAEFKTDSLELAANFDLMFSPRAIIIRPATHIFLAGDAE